jgi:hypothetical protein
MIFVVFFPKIGNRCQAPWHLLFQNLNRNEAQLAAKVRKKNELQNFAISKKNRTFAR